MVTPRKPTEVGMPAGWRGAAQSPPVITMLGVMDATGLIHLSSTVTGRFLSHKLN
jgi:hypothetical protein